MSSEQLRNELEEKRKRIEQIKLARLQQQQQAVGGGSGLTSELSTHYGVTSNASSSNLGYARQSSFMNMSGGPLASVLAAAATSTAPPTSTSTSLYNSPTAYTSTYSNNSSSSSSSSTNYQTSMMNTNANAAPVSTTPLSTPTTDASGGGYPPVSHTLQALNSFVGRPAASYGSPLTPAVGPKLTTTTLANVISVTGKAPPEKYAKEIQADLGGVLDPASPLLGGGHLSSGGGHLGRPLEDVSRSSSVVDMNQNHRSDTPPEFDTMLTKVPSLDDEAKAHAQEAAERQRQARKAQLLSRNDLEPFLKKSTLVMERALTINRDVFLERAAGTYDGDILHRQGAGVLQKMANIFEDEYTHNCAVTSLSFQPSKSVEFFCASYRDLSRGFHGSSSEEGFVLGWSLHVRKPAFRLSTPSELSNMQYCPHRPNLVIGGTYSGQVILWDTRKGPSPVVVTAVMKENHTSPIFGINVVGGASTHQLITTSNDGRMCTWNLDKMSMPVERTNLQVKEEVGDTAINKAITCTSIDFSHQDSEKFFVGGENGVMYSASRHSTQSHVNKVEGHSSPITSISCHPILSSTGEDSEMGNLVLSSSLDWTVNLWHEERSTLTLVGSFTDYLDYVYDARWSPFNASLFATGDGSGAVTLWNLSRSWSTPVGRHYISSDETTTSSHPSSSGHHLFGGGSSASGSMLAVNRLAWSPDGAMIAVGDSSGGISLLSVADHAPSEEDAQKVRQNVTNAHRVALSRKGQ